MMGKSSLLTCRKFEGNEKFWAISACAEGKEKFWAISACADCPG